MDYCEYSDRIENAAELLESFLENFKDETVAVQLQLLTAIVKLFLKKSKEGHDLIQKVLQLATKETDNPDLRDRGFVYWRLLSTNPEAAKSVVLAERPPITDTTSSLGSSLCKSLIPYIGSLASVYHKLPEAFISKFSRAARKPRRPVADDNEFESGMKNQGRNKKGSKDNWCEGGDLNPHVRKDTNT